MNKLLIASILFLLIYGCTTSSDDNGNTTTTAVPTPPENLKGEATSTTTIKLIWTDRSTNESGFKIERKAMGGTFAVVGTTATDIAIFSDASLTPSTSYVYRVFSYNEGGKSPVYSNELTLTTNSIIPQVAIGTQTWTIQNLDVTTYRDGTLIPQVTDPTQWFNLTTGAWCYYNNDIANGTIYGKLYNWYAVAGIWNEASKTDKNQRKKLAPQGYHIPTDEEWTTLTTFLGGESVAGGKMKSTGTSLWESPNKEANNSSGFTGLPGGCRSGDGSFVNFAYNCYLWSSSENYTTGAWYCELDFTNGSTISYGGSKRNCFSVRCLMD
jgi:uncharacterized protein (TIGR02145 family)